MKLLFSSWNDQIIDNREILREEWNESSLKLAELFDRSRKVSAFAGWGGIILLDSSSDIVEISARYIDAVQKESCGRCFPCRIGTAVMQTILQKILREGTGKGDLEKLEQLASDIASGSKCSIGQTGTVPVQHALKYFRKEFENYTPKKTSDKNFTFAAKTTAPCMSACPTGMDIPYYIESVSEQRPSDSLARIRMASPMAASLGRACFHPCENACRRKESGHAISICKLKRYVWDYEDQRNINIKENTNLNKKNVKVAVIGAGVAGLSYAYYMALKGYSPTVFEMLPVPGGMAGVGIPKYRIPKDVLKRETAYIEAQGVKIEYGVKVGTDITIQQLREQGYRAFFVATGAHLSKKMGAEGEDAGYTGFVRGVDYLRDCELTQCYRVKDCNVIVVGGGNVAMDCCRTPVRLGAKKVTVVYRRTKKELPADPHEVSDSEIEGVHYEFLAAPKKIHAENGKVTGLECVRMELGEPDESGRRSPVEVKGSEYIIPADIIIQAIGQDCDLTVLSGEEGYKLTRWKTIQADPDTLQSDIPDIFTGGDVYNGPLTLVDACGNARRAAESSDRYLSNESMELSDEQKLDHLMKRLGVQDEHGKDATRLTRERVLMNTIDLAERVSSFKEVETGYTLRQATEEAQRCMRCYQVGMVVLDKADEKI